jgi:hypothetical protein
MFLHMCMAYLLEKGKIFAFLPHNCGAAMDACDMTLEQVFEGLYQAHERAKAELAGRIRKAQQQFSPKYDHVQVPDRICTVPYMHLDWGAKKKTYFFNRVNYGLYASDPYGNELMYDRHINETGPYGSIIKEYPDRVTVANPQIHLS